LSVFLGMEPKAIEPELVKPDSITI
jgi:hypothetical protein